jgi:hypothetical protein
MAVHTRTRAYSCVHCAQAYTQDASLQRHLRSAHAADAQQAADAELQTDVRCPLCGKHFAYKSNRNRHLIKCRQRAQQTNEHRLVHSSQHIPADNAMTTNNTSAHGGRNTQHAFVGGGHWAPTPASQQPPYTERQVFQDNRLQQPAAAPSSAVGGGNAMESLSYLLDNYQQQQLHGNQYQQQLVTYANQPAAPPTASSAMQYCRDDSTITYNYQDHVTYYVQQQQPINADEQQQQHQTLASTAKNTGLVQNSLMNL